MLVPVLKAVIEKSGVDPKLIEDVCIGNVSGPGACAHHSRMAMFMAGIPDTASVSSTNRQCSSGLQACINIANAIRNHQIDMGIGGGVESMSLHSMESVVDANILSDAVFDCPGAANCLQGMGFTSDNVAEKFNITREE